MTGLERWLSDATQGLSPESAARVRAEIQEHYDSAVESGTDAIAALGDPQEANRDYRKVLLTEREAMMAPVLTQSPPRTFRDGALTALSIALLAWLLARRPHDSGYWAVLIAILSTAPLNWFLPVNTLERSRIYLYIRAAHTILVIAVTWWYQGWVNALCVGGMCSSLDYSHGFQRLSIFRKLAAGQSYSPRAGELQLTPMEAIHLRTLEKGSPYENVSIAVLFLMLGRLTFWLPATFAPLTICMVGGFMAQRTLAVYTEEGSRWFRIAKWTSMVVAGVLPVVYGARVPWAGAFFLAFFFLLFDMRSISLRRKLPVAEWPKRLYW